MFFWLLYPLREFVSFFRLFGYVTFRAVLAAITSLLITYYVGPRLIRYFRKLKYGESIRDDGPSSHQHKAGTPTMGGALILFSMSFSLLLWGNLSNHYFILLWFSTLLFGALGFADDYIKSIKKKKEGVRPRIKLLVQFSISLLFSLLVFYFPYAPSIDKHIHHAFYFPFVKDPLFYMGAFAIPFWTIYISGFSNAVNLTDGLDGLATGISSIVIATLAIFAYITGVLSISEHLLLPFIPEANELAVFLAALLGSTIGFLWYNSHPAEIFMGDTGSLALGAAIAMSAILIKREILLFLLGGVFVLEIVSVILQVGYFKATQKRIFKMAPLHHHFELSNWHENKVVTRFWIIGIFLALLSLSTLKIL